jgi:hypothetical protein
MKKYILLLVAIAFMLPTQAQSLVEKFRSEPGERWFNRAQLNQRSQGSFASYFDPEVDFNGLSYLKNDSLIILYCLRFTNGDDIPQDFLVSGDDPDENDLWGPINLDGEGLLELAVWRRSAGSPLGSLETFSLNPDAGTTSLTAQIDGVVGTFDVDGDGLVDIIQYDQESKTLVVLGVSPEASAVRPPGQEGEERSAGTYAPTLKFEGAEGEVLAYLSYAFWNDSDWDFNGNGTNEVILERTDANDQPVGLRIINGTNNTESLRLRFDSLERQGAPDFLGFYDLDGENGKEVYLSNGTVIERNRTVHYLPEHFVPAAFVDVDGDELVDILGRDTLADRVQIYGLSATTPVSEVFQQSLGLSVEPVFPNPASQSIQLPLQLHEAMSISFTLYDAAGRLVRTLAEDQLSKGAHLLNWSVAGLAKGIYHLQVRSPKGMLTQKVVVR